MHWGRGETYEETKGAKIRVDEFVGDTGVNECILVRVLNRNFHDVLSGYCFWHSPLNDEGMHQAHHFILAVTQFTRIPSDSEIVTLIIRFPY